MAIFDLFSKRQKRQRGEIPDVYQYNSAPKPLRVQIIHIWRSAFGDPAQYGSSVPALFKFIHETLCREYGIFRLTERSEVYFESVANFMLRSENTDEVIDVIELSFRLLDRTVREDPYRYRHANQNPDDAIAELNARFREHGFGFQYESGQLVRVDSQVIHSIAVKPTLRLLSEKDFAGANEEFLSAHSHYRNRKYKECLNDCLKSFESTMKVICTRRKWTHKPTDTAKALLDILFSKGLIPKFMQSHFSGLRTALESGVPTIRNKLGGHGQGTKQVAVPESIAAYTLHLTASNIVFLIQAEKELR